MRIKLKGFREGTIGITTGDRMKEGDHRRLKYWCRFYMSGNECSISSKGVCTGSAHCEKYEDNEGGYIEVYDEEGLKENVRQITEFVSLLKYKINSESLEGKYIKRSIANSYNIKKGDVERAKQQIDDFEDKSKKLKEEIEQYNFKVAIFNMDATEYNKNLKKRCIAIGLLIITAPFAYSYYKYNKKQYKEERDFRYELSKLKNEVVDDQLQKNVTRYKETIKKYVNKSKNANNISSYNMQESKYLAAIKDLKEGKIAGYFKFIKESIEKHNVCAILHLLRQFYEWDLLSEEKSSINKLILYASYLGDKNSSEEFANILLKEKEENVAKKFYEKAGIKIKERV